MAIQRGYTASDFALADCMASLLASKEKSTVSLALKTIPSLSLERELVEDIVRALCFLARVRHWSSRKHF